MNVTFYIYAVNGLVGDILSTSSATNGLSVKRGDNLVVKAIFHDGTKAVELPAGASGSLIVKDAKHYDGGAVLQAGTWTKQSATADGYVFALTISGAAMDAALGNGTSKVFDAEISWITGGTRTTTPTFNFTVLNNLTQ